MSEHILSLYVTIVCFALDHGFKVDWQSDKLVLSLPGVTF